MDKNSEENISPEIIAEMYISMTPEQKELFWKMLAEELQRYYDKQENFNNTN